MIISSWFYLETFSPAHIMIFHGGESQEPAVVMIPSGAEYGVTVLNPGSLPRTRSIMSYLTKNGVNEIEQLIFTENRKSCTEGAWMIFSAMNVRHLLSPPGYRRSRYTEEAIKSAWKNGAYISHLFLPDSTKRSPGNKYGYHEIGLDVEKESTSSNYLLRINHPESFKLRRREILPGKKNIEISTASRARAITILNSFRLSSLDVSAE